MVRNSSCVQTPVQELETTGACIRTLFGRRPALRNSAAVTSRTVWYQHNVNRPQTAKNWLHVNFDISWIKDVFQRLLGNWEWDSV